MAILDLSACGVRLERATKRHSRELARILRAKDREETRASCGLSPERALRMSINDSTEAWAAYAGDDLLAVFGVGPLCGVPEITVAWAMTSVHVDRHRRTFWRASKLVVEHLRGRHVLMVNMVHGKYTEALRWLSRLGFQIGPPEVFGPRGDLFCRAVLLTQRVVEVAHV